MFEKVRLHIVLNKDTFIAAKAIYTKPLSLGKFTKGSWTPETLLSTIQTLKARYKTNTVRILIGDGQSYVFSFIIPSTDLIDRLSIKNKIQEALPDRIEEIVWDYRIVAITNTGKVIQVVAVPKQLLYQIEQAFGKAGLLIEAIEPTSLALARLTQADTLPHVIIQCQDEQSIIVAHHGVVWTSEMWQSPLSESFVKTTLAFNNDHYQILPKNVILSGVSDNIDKKIFTALGLAIAEKQLDPLFSLGLKTDLKGNDEDVLNLQTVKISRDKSIEADDEPGVNSSETQIQSPHSSQKKILLLIPLILIIAVIASGIIFFRQNQGRDKKKNQKNNQIISPTISPIISQAMSPSPSIKPGKEELTNLGSLDLSKFKVKLLNGSGKLGEASKVKELLVAKGFIISDTGNADTYDYKDSVIRAKKETSTSLITALSEALKDQYSLSLGDVLPDTNDADIIVIIGSKTP